MASETAQCEVCGRETIVRDDNVKTPPCINCQIRILAGADPEELRGEGFRRYRNE